AILPLNEEPLYGILHLGSRRSSVVEHTLGKGEVESPILSDGTISLFTKLSKYLIKLDIRSLSKLTELLQNCHTELVSASNEIPKQVRDDSSVGLEAEFGK